MVRTKSILYYSLLSALVMLPADSYSAVKIGNKSRSYADAYNQVNEIRASVAAPTLASAHTDDLGVVNSGATVELPIQVTNQQLAEQIKSGESTTVNVGQLQNCASIYPNGEFLWGNPNAGSRGGTGSQCVSVVELRGYQMGTGGSDLVLARVNVAAGDSIKCNISAWPEYSYLPAAGTIEFPGDAEPTVEDVIAVMNQEQKQNAGLKIAAGTLVAAVAGNALGAKEVGKDSLLGTNKEKLQSTAIGGLTGAAIMAGNVYGGKVAGDMILSAGVNAAAGGLIGNMAASGDAVLKIENCSFDSGSAAVKDSKTLTTGLDGTSDKDKDKDKNKKEKDSAGKSDKCLWGMILKTSTWDGCYEGCTDKPVYFYDIDSYDVYKCTGKTGDGTIKYEDCKIFDKEIADIIPVGYYGIKDAKGEEYDIQKMKSEGFDKSKPSYQLVKERMEEVLGSPNAAGNNKFVIIQSGKIVEDTTPALLVGVKDKAFGWRKKDWDEFKNSHSGAVIMGRNANGQPVALSEKVDINDFTPMYQDAEDGALIDLGNKARLKGTLIGAGAGGALGAFTAYQGAQSEIQERWVAAVREYKDSLQKVYCATGTRFLTHYNDTVIIPNVSE